MIRAEFYVLPKLESTVHKHDKAYGVVVLGMHVGYVCVLDAEPSGSFIEYCPNLKFKFFQQDPYPKVPNYGFWGFLYRDKYSSENFHKFLGVSVPGLTSI
jgi:hypothetical protein